MSKPQHRDPSELSVHPAVKGLPAWEKEDARYKAMVEDVRARGIDQALIVDPEDRILDGRTRWRIAKDLQLVQVPVIVKGPDEIFGVAVNSLLQRKHYTKGQLAYVLAQLLGDAFEESERRRLANLAKNPNVLRSALSADQPKTVSDWAESIGVGKRLFEYAIELHELFRKHSEKRDLTDEDGVCEEGVTLRAFYEARILREEKPYGLGAVKAGIMASLSDRVKHQVKNGQLELFEQAFDALADWSGATAYVIGDWVWSGGTAYQCILGHTNHVPPNATYWAAGTPYPVDINFVGTWSDPNGDLVAVQILVKKSGGIEVLDEDDTMSPIDVYAFDENVNIAENGTWLVRLVGTDATGIKTERTIVIDAKGVRTQCAKPKFKWNGKKVKGTEWNRYGKFKLKTSTPGADINFQNRICEDRDWKTATNYVVGDKRWNGGSVYICYVAHLSGATTEPGVGVNWGNDWRLGGSAVTQWVTATNYVVGDMRWETDNHSGAKVHYMCISNHLSGATTHPNDGNAWRTKWVYAEADGSLDLSLWHAYDDSNEGFDYQPYGFQPTDNIHQVILAYAAKVAYTNSDIAALTIHFKRVASTDGAEFFI